jgi:hypothetical protein
LLREGGSIGYRCLSKRQMDIPTPVLVQRHPCRNPRLPFPVTTAQLDAVISIAIRGYWSRMWIIQEIQLPPQLRLHCGRKSISPSTFLSFLEVESADAGSYGYNLRSTIAFFLLDRRRSREQPQHISCHQKDGLHDWLSGCLAQPLSRLAQPFSATEPRDIVYALLGVSRDCQNGQLKPDYAKPLLEVHKDVFKLPARRRWQEMRSEMSTLQNIIYHESVLDNNLAFKLGLINKDRYLENECRVAQMLDEHWDPGHLAWPSGRFPWCRWDVSAMCHQTLWVALGVRYVRNILLVSLAAVSLMDYLQKLQRRFFVT